MQLFSRIMHQPLQTTQCNGKNQTVSNQMKHSYYYWSSLKTSPGI